MKLNKRKKYFLSLLIAIMFSYMITGCGLSTKEEIATNEGIEETTLPEDEDLIVVGFSQLGSESVWRSANSLSVQSTLTEENGYFLLFNNARQKQENQIKAIRSFISQRVDYIVFSPVTEEGWETVLQEAKDAGIPVILVDRKVSGVDESLYTTWVGTDARDEGEKAGRWLEGYLAKQGRQDEEINIVVLQGTIGSSAQLGRTIGFDAIAEKHSNWNILEQASGDFTIAKGKEVMQAMIRRYDDIDVVVSQNDDMTFGAIEVMEESGMTYGERGDTIVISFDAVHDALLMVQDGRINVDIECNPEQGPYIHEVIQMLENGEMVEKSYYVEEMIFTKSNVAKHLPDRTY